MITTLSSIAVRVKPRIAFPISFRLCCRSRGLLTSPAPQDSQATRTQVLERSCCDPPHSFADNEELPGAVGRGVGRHLPRPGARSVLLSSLSGVEHTEYSQQKWRGSPFPVVTTSCPKRQHSAKRDRLSNSPAVAISGYLSSPLYPLGLQAPA